MTSDNAHSDDGCLACMIIDVLDGKVDGQLFHAEHWTTTSEASSNIGNQKLGDRLSDVITKFSGSLTFLGVHCLWFGLWIGENLGLFGGLPQFDEYPFGLLTMIVSLEAIFLSTFVMITQNRQAERSEKRNQIDAESNIQSLIWLVHVANELGVDIHHVRSLCDTTVAAMRTGVTVDRHP